MAIKLELGIFKSAAVDLGSIFKSELKVYGGISNILDLDFFSFDVSKFNIEIKLQFINDEFFRLHLILLLHFLLDPIEGLLDILRNRADISFNMIRKMEVVLTLLLHIADP